jgi:hypothetical protein
MKSRLFICLAEMGDDDGSSSEYSTFSVPPSLTPLMMDERCRPYVADLNSRVHVFAGYRSSNVLRLKSSLR